MKFAKGAKTQDRMTFDSGEQIQGQLITTAIDGPLTGEPVDLLVIDDPVKGQKEARSPVSHTNAKEWMQSVANSRKHEMTSTVVISTRWHANDLIGYITEAYTDYEIINIPALCTDPENDFLGRELDEPIFPEHKSKEWLIHVRDTEPNSVWQTMYQGNPTPREDRLFDSEQIQYYTELPKELRFMNGVDLAYSTKSSADFTAWVTIALNAKTGNIYITKANRKRLTPTAVIPWIVSRALEYPYVICIEDNGPQKFANETIERALVASGWQFKRMKKVPVTNDKYTRAIQFSAAWNNGKVFLPDKSLLTTTEQEMITTFLSELLDFTGVNDKHDDMLDATTNAYNVIMKPRRLALVPGMGNKQ